MGAAGAIAPGRAACGCPGCAEAARYLAATVLDLRPVVNDPWFRRAEARGADPQQEGQGG